MLETNDGFKIGDIINGYAILKLARDDAFELVKSEQESKSTKKHVLLKRIMKLSNIVHSQ
ncbi:MAG: hypothetical protein GY777_21100 [Candidatus Brocadiaceae bacterium]|nr:hypothetical protein [Candidatus Brocadiaceae bacterium]